jgi:hypothetical protein
VPKQVLGDELIVRSNAAVQAVAGHAFGTIEDPTARKLQRVQFHKNVAMLGGLAGSRCANTTEANNR